VYGLLGENGAGKTTTLRMILGLLQPTSGFAEVDGFRSTQSPDEVKSRIGLVSTSAGLYQWLTPREMLLFFADLYNVAPAQAEQSLHYQLRLFPERLRSPLFLDVNNNPPSLLMGPKSLSRGTEKEEITSTFSSSSSTRRLDRYN
jgi:ABC-type sugar transport system ATPase subunit